MDFTVLDACIAIWCMCLAAVITAFIFEDILA